MYTIFKIDKQITLQKQIDKFIAVSFLRSTLYIRDELHFLDFKAIASKLQ